jgi:hypothetical protein
MANLSFKQFMDLEERVKPSTIPAALRTRFDVPEKDVQKVLDGGISATPVSRLVATNPSNPNSKIDISIAPATFKLCKSKKCGWMDLVNDPESQRKIYMNKGKNRPAQDIYKPAKRSFMLGPVKFDQLIFQNNGNTLLQPGGGAGASAAPGGGLGGMLA